MFPEARHGAVEALGGNDDAAPQVEVEAQQVVLVAELLGVLNGRVAVVK
jgi:hypothetical protein